MAVKVDTPTHGVDDRLGLLKDLLLHIVLEAAFHDLGKLHLEGHDGTRGRDAVSAMASVDDAEALLSDEDNVVVLQVDDAARVLDDGAGVRGQKVLDRAADLVFAQAQLAVGLVLGLGRGLAAELLERGRAGLDKVDREQSLLDRVVVLVHKNLSAKEKKRDHVDGKNATSSLKATSKGEPRRVATISPGKRDDLKMSA